MSNNNYTLENRDQRKQLSEFVLTFQLQENLEVNDFDWLGYKKMLIVELKVINMKIYRNKTKPFNYYFVINQTGKIKNIWVISAYDDVVKTPKYLKFAIGTKKDCSPNYKPLNFYKFNFDVNTDYELLDTVGDYSQLKKETTMRDRLIYYRTLPNMKAKLDYITTNNLEGEAAFFNNNDKHLTEMENQAKSKENTKSNVEKETKSDVEKDAKSISNKDNIDNTDLNITEPTIVFNETLIKQFLKLRKDPQYIEEFINSYEKDLKDNISAFSCQENYEYSKIFLNNLNHSTYSVSLANKEKTSGKSSGRSPKYPPFFNLFLKYYDLRNAYLNTGDWYNIVKPYYDKIIPLYVKDKVESN